MSGSSDAFDFVARCRDLAARRPDDLAYTWLDGEREVASLTFRDVDRDARRIASLLATRGLAGQRALLVYSPGLPFVTAFLGCLYAGVTAVPLNTPRNPQAAATVQGIARHARGSILLTDSVVLGALGDRLAALAGVEVLATDSPLEDADEAWQPGAIDPASLAFLQYTSGSTGTPKGVEVTHANLVHDEEMIRAAFGHDEHMVMVGWLPQFHDMGLVGNVLQPLFVGGRSVLMAPTAFVQLPVRWLRAITRFGGTTAGSPNFGYELCVKRVHPEHLEGLDLSTWRVAYNGSEPVRAATLERFSERFAPVGFRGEAFYPCYGMAEASLFVTGGVSTEPYATLDVDARELERDRVRPARPDDEAPRRLVSCGRAWLDQRVVIVDPDTARPVEEGTVGEVWLQGSNIARGYRDLPADVDDPFRARLADGEGPFLRTGDLGFLHEGELFVTGRKKDLLIQRGRNVYPQDVELVASASHPHLRDEFTAAFTWDDGDEEHLVVVQEVHRDHAAPLLEGGAEAAQRHDELVGAVRAALSSQLGLHAWRVVLIPHATLPKTSSGKTQRSKTKALWSSGALPELLSGNPRDPATSTT